MEDRKMGLRIGRALRRAVRRVGRIVKKAVTKIATSKIFKKVMKVLDHPAVTAAMVIFSGGAAAPFIAALKTATLVGKGIQLAAAAANGASMGSVLMGAVSLAASGLGGAKLGKLAGGLSKSIGSIGGKLADVGAAGMKNLLQGFGGAAANGAIGQALTAGVHGYIKTAANTTVSGLIQGKDIKDAFKQGLRAGEKGALGSLQNSAKDFGTKLISGGESGFADNIITPENLAKFGIPEGSAINNYLSNAANQNGSIFDTIKDDAKDYFQQEAYQLVTGQAAPLLEKYGLADVFREHIDVYREVGRGD